MSVGMARAAPQPPQDELAKLESHIRELQQRRRELTAEQIAYEKQGVVPAEPKPADEERRGIARFMNGFRALGLVGQPNSERLWQIVQDQRDIDCAVSQLEQDRLRLQGERDAAAAATLDTQNARACARAGLYIRTCTRA